MPFDFFVFHFFSPVYAVMKQRPVLVFHTTQSTCKEISVKSLSKGHKDVLPSTGIEPATSWLPARRFN